MTSEEINIYCDESCHLLNDKNKVMVIGGIICPNKYKKEIFKNIRELKAKYNIKQTTEIKWTKVSKSREAFYIALANFFFENKNLAFRAVLVPDKQKLDHEKYGQTHDEFYYKIYYDMLKKLFVPFYFWNIYIDEKDTNGSKKIEKLKRCLRDSDIKIQEVKSKDVELIQMADIFLGAIAYKNRGLTNNRSKLEIINVIESHGYLLDETTPYIKEKFNILKWKSREDL
ncbi:DUF3800 domain-containing protein [bacterium]|nr:DUF3800 domain-containing protein [bacterium]